MIKSSIQKTNKSKNRSGDGKDYQKADVDVDVKIKSGEEVGGYGKLKSNTSLDEFFSRGGFPYGHLFMFSGIDNTGKSTFALHLGCRGYEETGKKCLYILTETESSIEDLPTFENNKDAFDVMSCSDLKELHAAVDKVKDTFGSKYNVVVVDSFSQPGEREDYLPDRPSNMMPYRERASHYKSVLGAFVDTIKDVEEGRRDPFMIVTTGHVRKEVRPDAAREEELIDPEFSDDGKIQSAYAFTGSTPMQSRYLDSHVFIFKNLTQTRSMKGKSSAEKKRGVPTMINVSLYKSRSTSLSVEKKFMINDDGVK